MILKRNILKILAKGFLPEKMIFESGLPSSTFDPLAESTDGRFCTLSSTRPLVPMGEGLASESVPVRPLPHCLTPLLFKLGGNLSVKKLMAGEIEEKIGTLYLIFCCFFV